MKKPIVQQHDFGCGVACVACVTLITYRKALSLFDRPEDVKTKGYWCRDLIAALSIPSVNNFWLKSGEVPVLALSAGPTSVF